MSLNPDQLKNPLIRDGVSQRQRQTASFALAPDFVKLDERNLADALIFAHQLSHKLNYYSKDGKLAGDWTAFFASSTPVQIALISKTRSQFVKDSYDQALQVFLEKPSEPKLTAILQVWKQQLLTSILQWHRVLEPYTPLKSVIHGLVNTNLVEPLIRMKGFEKISGQVDEPFYKQFVEQFGLNLTPRSSAAWRLPENDDRTELDAVFQALFQTYRQIVRDAPQYLGASLNDRSDHPPHLALYFAFWDAMQPARDDLNQMTERHLDFFYRKVLRLSDRAAIPDRVHLLFELAKLPTLVEFKLPSGTLFKAGKDAIGKELLYQLDKDIVVHKAKIASLKGLFLDRTANQIRGLYGSAIANSFDGQGGAFPKEQVIQSWLPFGNKSRNVVSLGFAIASDGLLLKEGDRTITLTLTLRDTMPDLTPNAKTLNEADLKELFKIKVSGQEKDWVEAQLTSVDRSVTNDVLKLVLTIKLAADQSPLIPYQPALPGAVLPTTKPVLLVLLNSTNIDKLASAHFLQSLQLMDFSITTEVDQVRDLVIQNDLSVLDANKPFQPFGTPPQAGNNFYIGSQEVFQKHLTQLKLTLKLEQPAPQDWLTIYAAYDSASDATNADQVKLSSTFQPGKLSIQALRGRVWSPSISSNLFNSEIDLTAQLATLKLNSPLESQPVEAWTNQTQNSFLRLQLFVSEPSEGIRSDFLHSEYPTVLARQMVAVATNPPGAAAGKRKTVIGAYYRQGTQIRKATQPEIEATSEPIIPKEPYLPVIQSMSISYHAIASRRDCTLFLLFPFDGFLEVKSEVPALMVPFAESRPLFEGELLIGVQDLDPPTALPLLFQVVEESADATLKKAEVEWFYLKDNTWKSLSDRIVSDTTNGLVASGIVQLAIPADISRSQTTILDPTLYWLKARVLDHSRAICDIINVHTQAAQVRFMDAENDPNHLAVPLAAGTIAKFEVPLPEIKTVAQPYASFGGQLKEQSEHFNLRVSEHLRHKGRAVTVFDYERLILEKFPEIYKVRCINHGLLDEMRDQMYELVPGGITLAVVPDLSRRISPNDLEPKVNVNLLDQIQEFVASLSSPWAEIKVVNPRYEKIQIECQVKFKSPYDANFGYYSRTLNQAITDFLAPWTRNIHAEIQFGGRLYYSAVVDFIEQQDYVDYLVDFKMNLERQVNVKAAIASTPRSVLTSGASTPTQLFHKIQEFKEDTILPPQRLPQPNLLGYKPLVELILDS